LSQLRNGIRRPNSFVILSMGGAEPALSEVEWAFRPLSNPKNGGFSP
jgi:hypothetical protein